MLTNMTPEKVENDCFICIYTGVYIYINYRSACIVELHYSIEHLFYCIHDMH